nr:zinc finger protein 41-like [Dermacentor andersoni]
MTEQGNGGHTPPTFTFMDEATAGTSREGGEGALGTSDDYPPYVDEYINDVWEVMNSQTDATDINDATASGSTNHTPVESSASADHSRPSTSHAGIEQVSSTTEDTARLSEDAWRYQGYTQTRAITDDTCNVDGVADHGSTSYLHLGAISSMDNARPSTSRAGMKDASASFEDGATNATGTGEREQQASCGASRKVSSRQDTLPGQPNKHTGDTAPTFRARDESSVKNSSHKCETCGKLLSGAFSLTEHYRTHTGERPLKCEICKKSFAHRGSFYKHQQIHTRVKPHICQICTKPFNNKDGLISHLKSHSSDRPFVCDICNHSFKWNTDLRRHRKRTH